MTESTERSSKQNLALLYILTLVACVVILYVRIRLLSVPLERDEGEYAYMGQLLLKGIPPYASAYTMKLPGTAMIYALFMAIFGQTTVAIHLGFLLINGACTAMVFLLARRHLGTETALIAGTFYAIISLSSSVLGVFAHATHFVVLFSLAGILVLGRENRSRPLILVAGICYGMAVLMKQHAAILVPFGLLFQLWPKAKGEVQEFLKDSLVFTIGVGAPYLVIAAWFFKAGTFERFWFWTVQYAAEYASSLPLSTGLAELFQQGSTIIRSTPPIWVLAAAGIPILCRKSKIRTPKYFFIGYLAVSFVMIAQGLYFRAHYFVLMLPAVAILSGYAAQHTATLFPAHRLGQLAPAFFLVLASGSFFYCERDYLFRLPPAEVSRKIYGTNPFPEAMAIGDYLRTQTSRDERIAILGSEPEILFYADRLSATGHIYMYGLMEAHRYAETMQRQLIEEIESATPAFIVVVSNPASWLLRTNSVNKILDWGDSYLAMRYEEVAMVEIFGGEPTRWVGTDEIANHEPESPYFVSIFKRR